MSSKMRFYIDRTVYCRTDEDAKREVFKEKIEALGGHIETDILAAPYALIHPAYARVGDAFKKVPGHIMSYAYILDSFDLKKFIPIDNYVGETLRPATISWRADEGKAERAKSTDSGSLQDFIRFWWLVLGEHALQAISLDRIPPVPTLPVPDIRPFDHGPTRNWACAFIGWHRIYVKSKSDDKAMQEAAERMAEIIRTLSKTTFRTCYRNDQTLADLVCETMREAEVLAKQNKVAYLDGEELEESIRTAKGRHVDVSLYLTY
ncbi:hypothetical protein AURDEDRAFT_177511 [Auricularia subglabra TFB-10046 SS5]|uniref:Uncharacterized protein n=1 Tax=Auricularia subglabra (strain TFB-10046 / SS5) TaxID=717982 RepID=J0WNH8_AURST|nr:hypothetical protein AURDEDRAFT_177511 [Auricularia subglabra TFB-10046 SS5]